MDSLITAAGRALAAGDALGALNFVALRDDPPALALRGIAMAQLGDLPRAKALVLRAARAFGAAEPIARARCIVAEAEIALASRDIGGSTKALESARITLERHGDRANAAHARFLQVRRSLLIGRIDDAEKLLHGVNVQTLQPALRTVYELAIAGIAMRRLDIARARTSLVAAREAAIQARIAALLAEVDNAAALLKAPAARAIESGAERLLRLDDVATLFQSDALIIDATRHAISNSGKTVSLAARPVLFALLRRLGEAWPNDVPRRHLITATFQTPFADETHRARLRVEIGRLRALLRPFAALRATSDGFLLAPLRARRVVVLARPVDSAHSALRALLADGEAWSSSALALALDVSQRTVQRALDELECAGDVQSIGEGRSRRWTIPPMPGFATTLLLPTPLPSD